MIGFRDFMPHPARRRLAFFRRREDLSQVLARAHAWIASQPLKLLDVETLLLPASAAVDTHRRATGLDAPGAPRVQVVRVWYQTNGVA